MVLLGDEAQLKARFGPFGDRGNIEARWVHSLRRTYHRLGNRFGTHLMELLADVGCVESSFGLSGDGVTVGAR